MQVSLGANVCDLQTQPIAQALVLPLEAISQELSNDYGGLMEHLWIDVDLLDDRGPYSFRFQRQVGGSSRSKITGLPRGEFHNVGHYSVKPDIAELLHVPQESVVGYVLQLLYRSTTVLVEKKKRLGGFDAERFRSDFLAACIKHGYDMHSDIG